MEVTSPVTPLPPEYPLCVHVLWHPRCEDGPLLAQALFRWLQQPPNDLYRAGFGVPVFFVRHPREHRGEEIRGQISVIVALVDEHVVLDPKWRHYLRELALADAKPACMMYPVALHPAAYNLPEELARLNFLRVDHLGEPAASESPNERRRRRAARLRSEEATVRGLFPSLRVTTYDRVEVET